MVNLLPLWWIFQEANQRVPNESDNRDNPSERHQDGDLPVARPSDSPLRFRPWPCRECRQETTPIGYLVERQEAGGAIPQGEWDLIVDEIAARESRWLIEWAESCEHTREQVLELPLLDEGSEHTVFLDSDTANVFKALLPGCFGEFYFIADGRMNQRKCSPLEYLARLRVWQELFGNSPVPLGVTARGQIVTIQKYIAGSPPTQDGVNDYLAGIGLTPVRVDCWLWKQEDFTDDFEAWLGDARDSNFVLSDGDIVPIDIRLWLEWRPGRIPAG